MRIPVPAEIDASSTVYIIDLSSNEIMIKREPIFWIKKIKNSTLIGINDDLQVLKLAYLRIFLSELNHLYIYSRKDTMQLGSDRGPALRKLFTLIFGIQNSQI